MQEEQTRPTTPSSPRPPVRNFSHPVPRASSLSAPARTEAEEDVSAKSARSLSIGGARVDGGEEGGEASLADLRPISSPISSSSTTPPVAPPPRSSRRPSPSGLSSPAAELDPDAPSPLASTQSLSPLVASTHHREESDSAPPLPQFLPSNSSTSFKSSLPTSTSLQSVHSHTSTLSFDQIVFKTDLPIESSDNPADYYSPVEGSFPHQNHMQTTASFPTPSSPEDWTPPSVPTLDSAFPLPNTSSSSPAPPAPPHSNPSTWRFPLFGSNAAAPSTPTIVQSNTSDNLTSLPLSPKTPIIDLPQQSPLPPPSSYLSPPPDPTGPVPKRRASSGIYTPPTFPGPAGKPRSPSAISTTGSPGLGDRRISVDKANAGRSSSMMGLGFAFSGLGLGYPSSPGTGTTSTSPQPPSSATAPSFLARGRSWLGGSAASSPTSAVSPSSPLPLPGSPASYFSSLLSPTTPTSSTAPASSPTSALSVSSPPPLSPGGTLSPAGVYTPASFYRQQLNGTARSRSATGTSFTSSLHSNVASGTTFSPRAMTPLTPTSANLGRTSSSSPALPTQQRKPAPPSSPTATPIQPLVVKRKPVPAAPSIKSPTAAASIPLPHTPTSSVTSFTRESTPSLITTSSSANSLSTIALPAPSSTTSSSSPAGEVPPSRPDGGRDILSEMVGMGGGKTMVALEVDAPVAEVGGRVF